MPLRFTASALCGPVKSCRSACPSQSATWVIYDSQHFGTAQRRRRVFLVCDFGGKRAGQILFVPKSLLGYFEAGGTPQQGLTAFAQSGADVSGGFIEVLNDQGGDSMTVERFGLPSTLRSQTHGNLPIVASGFDLQQITSKTNRSTQLDAERAQLRGTGKENALGRCPTGHRTQLCSPVLVHRDADNQEQIPQTGRDAVLPLRPILLCG